MPLLEVLKGGEGLLEEVTHALDLLAPERLVKLRIGLLSQLGLLVGAFLGDFSPASIRQLLEMWHRILIVLTFISMIIPLNAPVSDLDGLSVLACLLQYNALAMQSSCVVRALLERPVVVKICTLEIAHFAIACAHIVAELSLKKFKILQPERLLIDIFFLGPRKVTLHRKVVAHQFEILIAYHEAFLVRLDRAHIVTILEHSLSLFL